MNDARTPIASAQATASRMASRNRFFLGAEKPRVTLLIPARNEERNLPWVLERVPAGLHEVILIDGHSTDRTVAVAQEYYPSIRVLQQRASGKGSALVTGMLAATGDIITMIDADGSMDPIEIHGLVGGLLSGADVVKSSRYLAGGGSGDISRLRNLGNRGLNLVAKALFQHDWSELCYGYAAFWADIVPMLNLDSIVESGDPTDRRRYGRGFEIETVLFTRALKAGLKVAEVPSFEYSRRFGESNLQTYRDGWRVLSAIVRERLTDAGPHPERQTRPVLLVGSGTEFLSGISHYTSHVAQAFAQQDSVAVILMRRLVPKRLYPGRSRVGNEQLSSINYPSDIAVFDGVDWHSVKSLVTAGKFIKQSRPRVVVLQWWTASVGLSYLYIARAAARAGAHVVMEFHEVQDVGEAQIPLAARTGKSIVARILRHTSGVVTHSSADAQAVREVFSIPPSIPIATIPHGPFELVAPSRPPRHRDEDAPLSLLFFGVIRPYKGLDILADAFAQLVQEGENVSLTVVGEPWQPGDPVLERLRGMKSATLVDEYVPDEEVSQYLEKADILVLPYRRASASGPLALAMAAGMPVVTTEIPSLLEVTQGYSGAIHVPVEDAAALADGIKQARSLIGKRHESPLSWPAIIEKYERLFDDIGVAHNPRKETT